VRGDPLILPELILPALTPTTSDELASELLDYLSTSIRDGWRPAEQYLQDLLADLPAGVERQVDDVQRTWQASAARQAATLTEFTPLLSGGDPERGRRVFFDRQTACAACHRVGSEGSLVGPDLTRIGAIRSPRDLLESVVLPGSTFAQGYENFTVVTDDGRVASGVIARQDDRVVVLRDASGGQRRLPRSAIDSITRQTKSLMPEGLPRNMTPEQFRDLLAFLQALK
jgi:putative heme-binding domain-containing protein